MSKKSKRMSQPVQAAGRKSSSPARPRSNTPPRGPGRARVYAPPAPAVDFNAVRIAAGVLGLVCLAGALAIFFRVEAPYPTATIILVVLLAFIAGLCAFAAVRTADFVALFHRLTR